jgi:hypothetical protein
MRVGLVIGLSVLAHCVVFALLALFYPSRPLPALPVPSRRIEVTLVEPRKEAIVVLPSSSTGASVVGDRSTRRPVARTQAVASAPTSRPAPARGTKAGQLSMRGPEAPPRDEVRTSNILDRIASAGESPSPPRSSGRLDDAPNGAAVIHDRVTTVTVDRDGVAHFHDKPYISFNFRLPVPTIAGLRKTLRQMGHDLAEWATDPDAWVGTHVGPKSDLPEFSKAVPGQCDTWGEINCGPIPPMLRNEDGERKGAAADGNFDLTAYLMRKTHVGDAYGARKRALLDDTRAERAARGGVYRSEQLARSAELMRRNLERLWATTLDPAARRVALFELWDESAEGDGPVGEAGERARAEVIGWIRAHDVVYSRDELAALAARCSSRQRFEP